MVDYIIDKHYVLNEVSQWVAWGQPTSRLWRPTGRFYLEHKQPLKNTWPNCRLYMPITNKTIYWTWATTNKTQTIYFTFVFYTSLQYYNKANVYFNQSPIGRQLQLSLDDRMMTSKLTSMMTTIRNMCAQQQQMTSINTINGDLPQKNSRFNQVQKHWSAIRFSSDIDLGAHVHERMRSVHTVAPKINVYRNFECANLLQEF